MTVQTWEMISLIGFVLGIVLFLLSGFLFWFEKIPKVFGVVTGKTAKKAIADMQKQSEETGRVYSRSRNLQGGKSVNPVSLSGSLIGQTGALPDNAEVVAPQSSPPMGGNVNDTTLLSPVDVAIGSTTLLSQITSASDVSITKEITFIHTTEVIV